MGFAIKHGVLDSLINSRVRSSTRTGNASGWAAVRALQGTIRAWHFCDRKLAPEAPPPPSEAQVGDEVPEINGCFELIN